MTLSLAAHSQCFFSNLLTLLPAKKTEKAISEDLHQMIY